MKVSYCCWTFGITGPCCCYPAMIIDLVIVVCRVWYCPARHCRRSCRWHACRWERAGRPQKKLRNSHHQSKQEAASPSNCLQRVHQCASLVRCSTIRCEGAPMSSKQECLKLTRLSCSQSLNSFLCKTSM